MFKVQGSRFDVRCSSVRSRSLLVSQPSTPKPSTTPRAESPLATEPKRPTLPFPSVKTDYDSPWKDILEIYFQSALELCFPQIARHINWSKGVQLLSKEFQKIVRRSELGVPLQGDY